MNYKSYPKCSDTPNRKIRKSTRGTIFLGNKKMRKALLKAKRLAARG